MHTAPATMPKDAAPLSPRRLIGVVSLALALGYAVLLFGTYLQGHFLTDAQGQPIANDFVDVYAAGQLALEGAAATAYDWPQHKAAEVRALGHDFPDYYGWHYPPPFLFVAMALALLPYLAASLLWLAATLAAYATALRAILGERSGILLALGFPAAVWNITAGQNGFLTASLIGGTLALLERRPVLAGICLGLLTYKPQFGLLFPLVLIVDRRWTTIAVAALVAFAMAAASWLAFGSASWQAFVHWMPITSHVVLGEGRADFGRLQSLFGLVRAHGGSEGLAWSMQAAGSLATAALVVWLWRRRAAYEQKAAALAAGALLVTPYVYMYDLVVLAVAVAFLLRHAFEHGLAAGEVAALAAAGVLILSFPYVKTQVGLAAVVIVMMLIVHRAIIAAATAISVPATATEQAS
ncbi:MAG TPA: glycosyltransferase family 87 protein [Xanthobacteraceae bacterium]|nr:glycosyltransferase family 87 protein [Xanthobacteraceae bacterium]